MSYHTFFAEIYQTLRYSFIPKHDTIYASIETLFKLTVFLLKHNRTYVLNQRINLLKGRKLGVFKTDHDRL